ncbi:MAG: hypothetical protein SGPRY_010277, partial [Prymnesium sp.]
MCPAGSMERLPQELLSLSLAWLAPVDLMRLAATCYSFNLLTDAEARRRCGAVGIESKGHWCGKRSWRVQLKGRNFRLGGKRVLSQLGSAGTRQTRQPRTFSKPVSKSRGAHTSHSLARRVLTERSVVVSLQDGSIVRRIPVDGVPTGICYLGNHRDAVAISVQGRAESGASINGVANPTDRVEVYPLNDTEWNAVGEGKEIWSESGRAAFSYPNGIDVRVVELTSPWQPGAVHAVGGHTGEMVCASISRGDWRPSDVAVLSNLAPDQSDVIAVADYYGNS